MNLFFKLFQSIFYETNYIWKIDFYFSRNVIFILLEEKAKPKSASPNAVIQAQVKLVYGPNRLHHKRMRPKVEL